MLPLEGNNIIIGRKDAVLQVPLDLDLARYDPGHAVSRRHACIEYQAGSYYLLDLQSTNGTRLNGEPVIPGRKMPLQDGAVIEFGLGVRLTFVAAKPAPRPRQASDSPPRRRSLQGSGETSQMKAGLAAYARYLHLGG
jgi:pSer/pThr/pTyr-binding forkhead associated (FHA) protein